ncbi:MAG TPA: GAF domain-containing protein [Solirubrobacteraceae bacterium]|nr:GAF domain-containing protein [Solirubrobacteraceae bacterium]
MTAKLTKFLQRYREGFHDYLRDRDEHALNRAYELGRSAVAQDLRVLDLAAAHQDVLLDLVRSSSDSTGHEELIRATGEFFFESVSAFEVLQHALQEVRETALLDRRHATILRHLSSFLADASLAFDASDSLRELLQLVAEHARELTGAEQCAVRLRPDDDTPPIDALAIEHRDAALGSQLNDLAALYRALGPPRATLRMTAHELDRHRADRALRKPVDGAWEPRGWLVAPLTALDGRQLGLIQAFDKHGGEFSELDEATLMQLAQMASAAVERTQLYRRIQDEANAPQTSGPARSAQAPAER